MSSDSTQIHGTSTSAQHAADAHGAHAAANGSPKGSAVFETLIESLGDHHELNIFFGHFDILPIILVDNGLHVYANAASMEAAGAFTLHHGHPVRKADPEGASQPFDLSITNLVAYQFLAIALVLVLFGLVRRRYIKTPTAAPTGLQNMLESVVLYVRDQIVRPNVGTERRTERLMPLLISFFFFILTLNLIGLLPGAHAATGALGVTMALALVSFITVNYIAMRDAGIGAWFHHLLGGAPLYIAPIMVPIEIVSLFTKPFALMIRLFANMTAGHIVLLSLVGLIFFFESWVVTPISVGFSLFIYMLELLVAFLQAYIFTMLTAVFIGLALGEHATQDSHHSDDLTSAH